MLGADGRARTGMSLPLWIRGLEVVVVVVELVLGWRMVVCLEVR
jgi:hypothetical protein